MDRPSVLVLCIGNPSRGDDAIGARLHDALEQWLGSPAAAALPATVLLHEDFQLQLEHALDLRDQALALIVDAAAASAPWPLQLLRVQPDTTVAHTSHALSPGVVLQVYRQIEWQPPPPTFALAVKGESFGLGEGLSDAAAQRVEVALQWLVHWLQTPELAAWNHWADAPPQVLSRPPPQV